MDIKKYSLLAVTMSFLLGSELAYSDDEKHRVWIIDGIPVTGANDVCGVPQWKMPAPLPEDAHFTLMGSLDTSPGATNALPLTVESCADKSTLLATYSNTGLNMLGGFPDSDDRLKNIPPRNIYVKTFPDGTHTQLPAMNDTIGNPFPPTRNLPDNALTVADWFEGSGKIKIECYEDNSSSVRAKFKNLVPNSVYSFVATWLTTFPGQTTPSFASVAFGGVPNIVTPDINGSATFERTLSYCPVDSAPDGSIVMFLALNYHADGTPHGVFQQEVAKANAFMTTQGEVFFSTSVPGVVTLPHINFPINVQPR